VKLDNLVKELSLEVKTCEGCLQNDITGAYVSDLLSDVMGNSRDGNVWITLQTHMNIVAVAGLRNLTGIIIVGGRPVEDNIIKKAEAEKVAIMTTPMPAFEVAGKIYQMLK
jgi:predicted transcriptional regulator